MHRKGERRGIRSSALPEGGGCGIVLAREIVPSASSRRAESRVRASRFPRRCADVIAARSIGALKRRKTHLVALSRDEIQRKTERRRYVEMRGKRERKRGRSGEYDNVGAIKPAAESRARALFLLTWRLMTGYYTQPNDPRTTHHHVAHQEKERERERERERRKEGGSLNLMPAEFSFCGKSTPSSSLKHPRE